MTGVIPTCWMRLDVAESWPQLLRCLEHVADVHIVERRATDDPATVDIAMRCMDWPAEWDGGWVEAILDAHGITFGPATPPDCEGVTADLPPTRPGRCAAVRRQLAKVARYVADWIDPDL